MAKVIFITGQSNAQGRANSSLANSTELDYHSNCLIWNKLNNNFQPLKIGAYANNESSPSLHGVELPLAINFKNNFPTETIYIIKHALGGVNIDACSVGGTIYETFKNEYFQPAINFLLEIGVNPEIYIYYSQGEADSTASRYIDFNEKLSLLMNNYKNILCNDIRFIFPEIIEDGILTNDAEINNIFKNYEKNNNNINVLNGKNYPSDDNLHWNYEGVNLLGADLFEVISKRKGGEIKYSLPYDFTTYNIDVISQNKKIISEIDLKYSSILNFPFNNKGVVYIDIELADSNKSKLNNKFLPFHNLTSAINSLPADNNQTWVIYFINGGNTIGCELPFRNLEFYSNKDLIIDFTEVNQGGQIINNISNLANSNNIISHNYISNNIKIISNYTGVQRFTNGNIYFKLSGNLAFNLKSSGGTSASSYNVQSLVPTELIIREWYCYNTHGSYILGFKDGSNVKFEKIINIDLNNKNTFRFTNYNTEHNSNIEIDEINFVSGEFKSLLPINIKKLTGNGILNSKKTIFNNCISDNGVSFNFQNAEQLEGVLISNNSINGNVSTELNIRNFEGKINNLTVTGKVICKGVNEINATVFINTSKISNALDIYNGVTIINGTISNNGTEVIQKGILKIN